MRRLGRETHMVHPCERRVDGDRVTELIPARDWIERPDANPLVTDEKGEKMPTLPRHSTRDHLHDRNRSQALFDPANPGVTTYVRVTRRRMPTEVEEEQARSRNLSRLRDYEAREAAEAAEANELLELRSMGIRAVITERNKAGPYGKDAVKVPPPNARADFLEKKVLGTDHTIADSLIKGVKAGHGAGAPAPAPAPATGMNPSMRGAKASTQRGQLRGGLVSAARIALLHMLSSRLRTGAVPCLTGMMLARLVDVQDGR